MMHKDAKKHIANRITETVMQYQRTLADVMQRKVELLSSRGKLSMLVLFCVLSGSSSIYLLSKSFLEKNLLSSSITAINKPTYTGQTGDENTKATTIITKEEYKKIQQFKGYMDSLARSPSGKRVYDSVQYIHKGLTDSILLIEKIYRSQSKK